MSQLSELCAERNVRIKATYVQHSVDESGWRHTQWKVTLYYQGRRMSTAFRRGLGVTTVFGPNNPEDAADVLSCLINDALCVDGQDFETFCAETGHNPDSRKAFEIFKACMRLAPRVHRFLGQDFETFMAAASGH